MTQTSLSRTTWNARPTSTYVRAAPARSARTEKGGNAN